MSYFDSLKVFKTTYMNHALTSWSNMINFFNTGKKYLLHHLLHKPLKQ